MPTFRHKIDSIQVLRALAVILVVYTHSIDFCVDFYGKPTQTSFFYLENWGAIGLDLFFVISGFIMTRIINSYQGIDGWRIFARKRFIRIVPLYWGLSLLATLLMLRTNSVKGSILAKTVLFFPIFETKFVFPVIDAGWSLSYEFYFYLIITLLLLFQFENPKAATFLLLLLLSMVGVLVDSTWMMPRFLSSPLLLEFAFGIGSGLLYDHFRADIYWHRVGMFLAFGGGFLLMTGSIFWGFGNLSEAEEVIASNTYAFMRSIVWGLPCALFLLGAVLLERVYAFTVPKLLLQIGDASYSNYLLHGMIIAFGRTIFSKLNLGPDLYIVMLVTVCTLISIVFYQFVEKPFTERLNLFFSSKTSLSN